eukprot:COSAG03_NODE_67_length_15062_cov_86.408781_15_plen_45_part_00
MVTMELNSLFLLLLCRVLETQLEPSPWHERQQCQYFQPHQCSCS